jgi:hypothetical protein
VLNRNTKMSFLKKRERHVRGKAEKEKQNVAKKRAL